MNQVEGQKLSKKEKRQLKKEQKRLKKRKEIRRKRLTKWSFILGTIVLLTGGFFLFKYIKAKRYENASRIQLTPELYNFGKISASKGKVETRFRVENIGASSLIISGMETSCACTTAVLKDEDQESPVFGMHGNPTDWSTNIESGEESELTVIFDPNFHQNTFGPVTRTISIFSNDPWKSKIEITILADIEK